MPLKFIVIIIFFINISACSSSPTSQVSNDTRDCNAISYGDKNIDTQSIDSLFDKCMADRKSRRDEEHDDEVKRKWFEFFITLFDGDNTITN